MLSFIEIAPILFVFFPYNMVVWMVFFDGKTFVDIELNLLFIEEYDAFLGDSDNVSDNDNVDGEFVVIFCTRIETSQGR